MRHGQVRRVGFSLAQPTPSELARMLHDVGFDEVRALDETGAPLTPSSRRTLMLAR